MPPSSETTSVSSHDRYLPWWIRSLAGGLAIGLSTLLITAATLRPSKNGLGTHQQLGLPPCTVRVAFGIPCPSCGMTTSWSHFMRGRWTSSIECNAGGFLLAVVTTIVIVRASIAAIHATPVSTNEVNALAVLLVCVLVVTMIAWILRITN